MLRPISRHISYANVVATLALVAATSGTAFAAAHVTSAQVRNNSLRGIDVRNGSLTRADVRDGSLTGADLRDGSVAGTDIRDGSLHGDDLADRSVPGVKLTAGSIGQSELAADVKSTLNREFVVEVAGTAKTVAGGATVEETVQCPAGTVATGGGGYSYYADKGYLSMSTPKYGTDGVTPVGWTVRMQNLSGSTNYLIIRALCGKLG